MVTPGKCANEAEIRNVLLCHAEELVEQKQEVRIAWQGTQEVPVRATITGYVPPGNMTYADTLGVDLGKGIVYLISPAQIIYFEVLATRLLSPDRAHKQMLEMETILGTKKTP